MEGIQIPMVRGSMDDIGDIEVHVHVHACVQLTFTCTCMYRKVVPVEILVLH